MNAPLGCIFWGFSRVNPQKPQKFYAILNLKKPQNFWNFYPQPRKTSNFEDEVEDPRILRYRLTALIQTYLTFSSEFDTVIWTFFSFVNQINILKIFLILSVFRLASSACSSSNLASLSLGSHTHGNQNYYPEHHYGYGAYAAMAISVRTDKNQFRCLSEVLPSVSSSKN